jgi:transposase
MASARKQSDRAGGSVRGRGAKDLATLERRRLRAGRLFERGVQQAEVMRRVGATRSSVSRWYRAWEKGGLDALRTQRRAGRPTRMTAAQRQRLERALLKGARAHGYETDLWTLDRVGAVITKLTGVEYHRGHVWKILQAMGWSRQRPARRAIERDDAAVERWVKDRWPKVKKTPGAATPGSSSRTSQGSRSSRR